MFRRCLFYRGPFALLTTFEPFELYGCKDTGVCEIVAASKKNTLNLLDKEYFTSLINVTHYLSNELNDTARVAILTSREGTSFSAGLDLQQVKGLLLNPSARGSSGEETTKLSRMSAMHFQRQHALVRFFQDAVSSLARCRIPIICAIDGHCIGGATSIITACDFRYATETASFSVKEAQVGLAADIGVLQRLPRIVGEGRARELVYSARLFNGKEAQRVGLVEEVFSTREAMMTSVREKAAAIAANSPLAVQGSKRLMNYQTETDVQRSLEYTASWSAANLPSDDVMEASVAFAKKRPPQFKNYVVDTSSTVSKSRE